VLFVMAFLVANGRLLRLRSGRALLALREDEVLASSLGVHPARHRVLAFALSAIVAAFAGAFYASYLKYITPEFFGQENLVTMIVVLVVGGAGLRFGPLVGAVVYVALVDWLPIGGTFRAGLFGLVLIVIVIFARDGVAGLLLRLSDYVRRRLGGRTLPRVPPTLAADVDFLSGSDGVGREPVSSEVVRTGNSDIGARR
jgi:branched-chain amino acid transport system permease protein